jgi:hypothetical protein
VLSSHDTATELPEDIGIGLLQVRCCEAYAGEEITLVGNAEEATVVSAHTAVIGQPEPHVALTEVPAAAQSRSIQSGDAGGDTSQLVSDREPSVKAADNKNIAESKLPMRRSKRLACKVKIA